MLDVISFDCGEDQGLMVHDSDAHNDDNLGKQVKSIKFFHVRLLTLNKVSESPHVVMEPDAGTMASYSKLG